MKICVIGDIHGTTKWIDCYQQILEKDNDCDKIIVLGDWFDPYENIPIDIMCERFQEFVSDLNTDNRIISILGNHDLSTYIIPNDCTNRTVRFGEKQSIITDCIKQIIDKSQLAFVYKDYIVSHAGFSQTWFDNHIKYQDMLLNNHIGWKQDELVELVSYSCLDNSGYGDDISQGCTWIRPYSLCMDAIDGYNQIIGHSQVSDISSITISKNNKTLWFVDNQRKSEYLTLNI